MTDDITRLVIEFQEGNRQAFTKLVKTFQRKVYYLAFKILLNHSDADEVAQETFVRVYRRIHQLKSPEYFESFVYRIATNYAIDLLRKQRGHSGIPEDTTSMPGSVQLDLARRVATPSENFEKKRLMEEVNRALDKLPPRQKLMAKRAAELDPVEALRQL